MEHLATGVIEETTANYKDDNFIDNDNYDLNDDDNKLECKKYIAIASSLYISYSTYN